MKPAEAQLEVLAVLRAVDATDGRSEAAEGRLRDIFALRGHGVLAQIDSEAYVLLWQMLKVYQADPHLTVAEVLDDFGHMFSNEL